MADEKDSPSNPQIEAAILRMTETQRSMAAAFQPNLAIAKAAREMAGLNWAKVAPQIGFGRTLVGVTATKALEGLAAHYNVSIARSVVEPSTLGAFRVAENLQQTFLGISGLAEQAKALLAPMRAYEGVFQQMQEHVQRFAEAQREIDSQLDAFVLKHGWPVPLTLPARAYNTIAGMADRPKREVTSNMLDWFTPRGRFFRGAVAPLLEKPLLETRRPLIRQVLRAHRRGDHYLVINGLMPLVEGVLVDGVFVEDNPPETRRAPTAVDRLREDLDSPLAMAGAVKAIERLVVSGAAGMGLFARTEITDYGGQGEPRALNRHAILHGYSRRYGSEANALRMILLLNVITEVIE
jgi:hypothetical protein